ncbi:hypothetical protein SPRG_08978 [Saprolegnia parasitica CBS 223.65]|uniref:Helicase-associated domain-containing protein n=1 Tax=Saprolegnia parasitica (strain CBS 223.65) TaxID=695850 RepID=A0A067C4L2_SAPPC|nr:hypothetical protein SPRG_08978 [Saprolegnia parasitica CBS 223.65]KDO25679.1 hypothetical protein SPRG_08978 [Saprolegnia parasitica CBS 223.65]|eukprot:XP_012203709.1 hypothetical protein SPRG_08978 [Saprolegnia parasitica CBS 223.65]
MLARLQIARRPWLVRGAATSGATKLRPERFVDVARLFQSEQQTHREFTKMPSRFAVPACAPWPSDVQGTTINVSLYRSSHKRGLLKPDVVAALDAIGFVWDLREFNWQWRMRAFKTYRELHGHTNVPQAFSVPSDDSRWPVHTWGLALGDIVHNLRTGAMAIRKDQRAQLEAIGFVWAANKYSWSDTLDALKTFRGLHGHVNVPQIFQVPSENPAWPPHTWGLKLGAAVRNFRMRKNVIAKDKCSDLNAIGFLWSTRQKLDETQIKH